MRNKLRSRRGESLAEVLASILIATLSVALLFGGVVTSSHIDVDIQEEDKQYYENFSAAERRDVPAEPSTAKLTITCKDNKNKRELDVNLYGGGGM